MFCFGVGRWERFGWHVWVVRQVVMRMGVRQVLSFLHRSHSNDIAKQCVQGLMKQLAGILIMWRW